MLKGISKEFQNIVKRTAPNPFYTEEKGCLFLGDSIEVLKRIKDSSVDLIFADPPYSIKKADWDTFENQEEYIKFSNKWIKEASRRYWDIICMRFL